GGGEAEQLMLAAGGTGVAAVDNELVGAEPGETAVLVERAGVIDGVAPARGWVDVDLDHAGIGRHPDDVQPRVGRRLVALDVHRHGEFSRGRLDRGNELEIVFQPFDRRHEYAQPAIARLDRQRGANGNARTRR